MVETETQDKIAMQVSDDFLLNRLFSDASGRQNEARSVEFCVIKRSGHILLLLPVDKSYSLKTLSLYEPQSLVAKAFIFSVKLRLKFFGTCFFKKERLFIADDSVIRAITSSEDFGLLLGNPLAQNRRCIIYHNDAQEVVTKIGFDASKESVKSELEKINSLPNLLVSKPSVLASDNNEGMCYYSVGFFEGASPGKQHDREIYQLLSSWSQATEAIAFRDLLLGQSLLEVAMPEQYREFIISIAGRRYLPVCLHGDFAAWNIKRNKDGEILVVDWEHACLEGIGGLDWIHYSLQRSLLVDKSSADEALDALEDSLRQPEIEQFLRHSGWTNGVMECIGTYVLYTHYVLGIEREELIKCWEKRK